MKKLISIALAVMLILSLATVGFAAEPGTITINNASAGNKYTIYKMLDLTTYDAGSGAYAYKVNSAWTGFFATTEALAAVNIDADGYVTWKDAATISVADFAKAALAYAKANGIASVQAITSDGTTVTFTGLELGYYLIDSTMGALCGLTTTDPNATIDAKNAPPIIDKQVQEDSTEQWGDSNTAEIGQVVNFRTTINVHDGAQNYVLHDKMTEGLSFNAGSVKVLHKIPDVSEKYASVDTHYTVKTSELGDDCTFHVVFTKEFCDHISTNDKVIVTYSATVNEKAAIGGTGDDNTTRLQFGENHYTEWDTTKTYTYGFDLVKTDSSKKLLDGAEFRLYDAATGGNEIKVVKVSDELYRRAKEGEAGAGAAIAVKGGKVRVEGLDNGVYYLEETKAPAGYNDLTARQKFTIADANLDATISAPLYVSGGVHVVNKTGSVLPETGAMGTALFVTFGTFLVLGTGVLLVTKKRMSMIED